MKPLIRLSHRKNKKYDVYYNGRWIPFGQIGYEHYKTSDLIPKELHIYPEHHDIERRKRYRTRTRGNRDGHGNLTYNNKNSANYWAYHLLWP